MFMRFLRSAVTKKAWVVFSITFMLSSAVVFEVRGQEVQFPNEIDGFDFFSQGMLSSVKFGQTTRSDIVDLFGNDCAVSCEYDQQFTIKVDYLSCEDCMTTEYVRDRAMCPLNEFMDTIEKITLTPKVPVHIRRVSTSRFPKHTGGVITSKDGSGGVSYESFGDFLALSTQSSRVQLRNLPLPRQDRRSLRVIYIP